MRDVHRDDDVIEPVQIGGGVDHGFDVFGFGDGLEFFCGEDVARCELQIAIVIDHGGLFEHVRGVEPWGGRVGIGGVEGLNAERDVGQCAMRFKDLVLVAGLDLNAIYDARDGQFGFWAIGKATACNDRTLKNDPMISQAERPVQKAGLGRVGEGWGGYVHELFGIDRIMGWLTNNDRLRTQWGRNRKIQGHMDVRMHVVVLFLGGFSPQSAIAAAQRRDMMARK